MTEVGLHFLQTKQSIPVLKKSFVFVQKLHLILKGYGAVFNSEHIFHLSH